jgi:transcriptional regulator with XRE-family HTH domain
MAADPPSVRERRLAAELRRARQAAQLNGREVAALTGWSTSKVSRIENGRIGIGAADLDRLLELYQVPPDASALLRRLAPDGRAHGWWEAYADSLSTGYATLLRLEAGSSALRSYCALIPHPLLMTPAYIRQVVRSTWQQPSATEIDRRVQVCLRRQSVLTRDEGPDRTTPRRLELAVVLDEAVLHRAATAGPARPEDSGHAGADPIAIRRDQLAHLLTAARWPAVTIQVLPFTAGIPPVSAGSFSLLESAATGAPDLVYLENKTRISFVDGEDEVDRYARDHRLLTELALPPADSADLIADLARGSSGR